MEAFIGMPYTTGHQTLLVGGVLIDFEYSLDGKGVITITIGDPWEVITKNYRRVSLRIANRTYCGQLRA
jgi:hypothetical protein